MSPKLVGDMNFDLCDIINIPCQVKFDSQIAQVYRETTAVPARSRHNTGHQRELKLFMKYMYCKSANKGE